MPSAFIAHRSAGRIRLKIPEKRGDRDYFAKLRLDLSQLEGVERVEANPLTASILICSSDPTLTARSFSGEHSFALKEDNPSRSAVIPLSRLIEDFFGSADRTVTGLTGGGLDLASLIFLMLAGTGIYQIALGQFVAPAWYTAFWYASGVYHGRMRAGGPQSEAHG